MDLSQLSIRELDDLRKDIDREVNSRKVREQEAAIRQIREIADAAGLSLDQVVGKAGKVKVKAPKGVKYRDPEDPSRTWSGRGRKPRWIDEAVRGGRNLEDFKV